MGINSTGPGRGFAGYLPSVNRMELNKSHSDSSPFKFVGLFQEKQGKTVPIWNNFVIEPNFRHLPF